jgi:exopolysaccharide biosynthesis polyprenyl glycosylphosphotransferase
MLKENWRFVSRVERLGDFIIICAAFLAAYHARSSLVFWNDLLGLRIPFEGEMLAPLKDYLMVLVIALLGYTFCLNAMGAYSSMRLSSILRLLRISISSSLIVFTILAAALFLLKLDLSRSFIGLFCSFVAILLGLERYLVLKLLRYWRRKGRNFRNILICGVGEQADRLCQEISKRPELGIGVRAFADLSKTSGEQGSKGQAPVFSGLDAAAKVLEDFAIDEVIFTDVVEVMPEVSKMIDRCSEQGIRTTIAADLFSVGIINSGISYFGGIPLIHYQTPPGDGWELSLKRGIDIVVSFLLSAIAIKFLNGDANKGPVLFKQKRVGLNGRIFSLYKFRSMYDDAETQKKKLMQANEMQGPTFKLSEDPRITPVGRLLRRFSIDELPQLWNVLRGDMSLVGPRPPIPGEVSMYERTDRRRLSMRPGLTCTWQVSGRNNIKEFETWVKLDLDYIDNWSLSNDLILLIRTIPAVLFGVGAR